MMIPMRLNSLSTLLLIALICLSQQAMAHVVSLTGQQLPALVGMPQNSFAFFAVQNGKLNPVAHQWISWSQEGTPWFASDDNLHAAGDPHKIQPTTRLLLRFQDGGERLNNAAKNRLNPFAEVAVNYNHQRHYFYLIKHPYRRNSDSYVQFNQKQKAIKTTHYALNAAPNNFLRWKGFFYKGYESAGAQHSSILDTMKLRLSAGVFSKSARITLTNANLEPHIEEVHRGPLAVVLYADTSLQTAGITVLTIRNYFIIEPNQTTIYARFTLPGAADMILSSPAVSISLDGNALYGSRLQTSWTGNKTAFTDGRLSPTEKSMRSKPMPHNGWIYFDTGHHFSLLAQLSFSKNLKTPVSLVYQDDAALANKPERFPGQQPNVGFSIHDIPFGTLFAFKVKLMYSGKSAENSWEYARSLLAKPVVSYKALQ